MLLISSMTMIAQGIRRIIRTGAFFQRVAPDIRTGGMGLYGGGWPPLRMLFHNTYNPVKYFFSRNYSSVGLSYTTYLSRITNDMFFLYTVFHIFLNEE